MERNASFEESKKRPHPLMESSRGMISTESAASVTTNESMSLSRDGSGRVDASPPQSTSSPSEILETDCLEKSPTSPGGSGIDKVEHSILMESVDNTSGSSGGGGSGSSSKLRRGVVEIDRITSQLPAIAEEKQLQQQQQQQQQQRQQQRLKRTESSGSKKGSSSSSSKRRNLAIEYIRTRSGSIDSTKICEDFYKDYLASSASGGKAQEYGFVQLDVLNFLNEENVDGGQTEWKEISRWIKYQEDLEGDGDRWGHPHIASLTFNSISTLRTLIETNGILLTDLKETNILGVISRVAEELAARTLIKVNEMPNLISTLLSKHKQLEEEARGWFKLKKVVNTLGASGLQSFLEKRSMSITSGQGFIAEDRRRSSLSSHQQISLSSSPEAQQTSVRLGLGSRDSLRPKQETVNIELNSKSSIPNDLTSKQDGKSGIRGSSLRNLLPPGAEATVIMVGDIEALIKPTFIFIRLFKSSIMPEVTEVDIPVRFLAILLVPANVDIDQLEIGRSVGALMSNRDFYELAMGARGMGTLVGGINEFLDESVTVSPGDWDNYDLLSRHKLQEKNMAIRIRNQMRKTSGVIEESISEEDELVTRPDASGKGNGERKKPYKEIESPFVRTGRPFGGLLNDIKRRYPGYLSDIKDGLNSQCFAAVIFMYFASLAQIVPFAVLMGEKTENMIGIPETLLPTAGAGVIFSIAAGQPLLLLGTTVPLLIFDEILFKVCRLLGIEFLPTRVWISLWCIVVTVVIEFFEGNTLIRWVTRFTQDIFICLTSCLLIFESFRSIVKTYRVHPLAPCPNNTYMFDFTTANEPTTSGDPNDLEEQPNTALLCTILTLGTFSVAYFLRQFKMSVYLTAKLRKHVGHFAVPIAIAIMLIVTYSAGNTFTKKLKVPHGLETTLSDYRGWFISGMGLHKPYNLWMAGASLLPGLLIYVIISMTTEICELLINTKERRLSKGTGFHLDVFLVAIINFICALFGAPWVCSPPMRAIAHVDALTEYSKTNPPGEKPTFIGVKEQRVTALCISILVGCSTFLAPLLKAIPLAVLFGVFMYMGVTALLTTQLFARFTLLFIHPIYHPSVPYVKLVRSKKMHMYTLVQLCCLVFLFAMMSAKEAALFFPIFLMMLVPVRLKIKRIFTEDELAALDDEIPRTSL